MNQKRFAQIQDNKVHWVFEAEKMPQFAPDIVLLDITDYPQVAEGWGFVNGGFVDPTPTLDELKAAKKAEIAAARYASAAGTISINGNLYHIDGNSQTAFLSTLAAFQAGALSSTIWKTADGRFVELSSTEFVQVVTIALAYINACFAAERSILEQVEAASSAGELAAVVWAAPDVSLVMASLG